MVLLQKVWWKEYFLVCAEYFYFPAVVFLFLRIAGRLEYCNLSILWVHVVSWLPLDVVHDVFHCSALQSYREKLVKKV